MVQRSTPSYFKISIVVLLLLMLAYIGVPRYQPDTHASTRSTCITYLKQLDSAKEQWAIDNHKPPGSRVKFSDLVGPTLYMKSRTTCPDGGEYSVNSVGKNPTCSHSGHELPQ